MTAFCADSRQAAAASSVDVRGERDERTGQMLKGSAAALILGSGVFTLSVLWHQKGAPLGASGFDVADVSESAPRASDSVPAAAAAPQSSLGLSADDPLLSGSESASSAPAAPAAFGEAVRKSGAAVSAFTARFRSRHPVMKEYSREWMSHADLKKLNDDYQRDHDQVAFVRGLAKSPSFGPLVRKIATDPASHALAIEFLTGLAHEAPGDLTAAAADVVKNDPSLRQLVGTLAGAFGVPSSLLPGLSGGTVDQKAVVDQVLASAPAAR